MRIQTLHFPTLFPTLLPTLALTIAALVVTGPAPGIHAQTPAAGYYTESQARRGFTAFNRNCAFCHTVDSTTVAEQVKSGRGLRVGVAGRSLMNLGGKYLMKVSEGHPDYPSVYYIFNRIRQGMPAFGSDAIGIDTKLDIVAYILQANGLPAGPKELTHDVPAMKAMWINRAKQPDETGFEPIFNGKDFSGWSFMMGPNCRQAPDGCGKTEPLGVFKIQNGELICTGKIQGYMYTVKKYKDFTWRFDYRFPPPPDWDDSDGVTYYGNSGYFLFINDHRIWPKGIQIEGYHSRPLLPFPMDTKFKYTTEKENLLKAQRPLGAWNSAEIASKNGQVRITLNGLHVYTITEHEFTEAGHIGFESEGSEIHWRNVRLKVE